MLPEVEAKPRLILWLLTRTRRRRINRIKILLRTVLTRMSIVSIVGEVITKVETARLIYVDIVNEKIIGHVIALDESLTSGLEKLMKIGPRISANLI